MTAGRKKEFDYMNGPINHARAEKKALETERYKLMNDWFNQGREQPKAQPTAQKNRLKPNYYFGQQHAYGNMKPEAPKPDYNAGQSHAYGNAGIKPKPNPNVMGPYAIKRPEAKQPRSSALDSYEPNKPHAQQWTPQMEKEHREIWDRLVNGNRSSKTDIIGMNPQSGNDDDRRSAPTKNLNPELQSEAWVYEGADEPEEQADDMLDPTYE